LGQRIARAAGANEEEGQMTTIEPWADLGQTKKQFMAYLLGLTEKMSPLMVST
jgi:hypothetical protein